MGTSDFTSAIGLDLDGIRDLGPYSPRNCSKGALIEEAHRVFTALGSGQTIAEIRRDALSGSLFIQRSHQTRKLIWTAIQHRYLVDTEEWMSHLLAKEAVSGAHSRSFVSLLYLMYALRDRLTFDFVTEVLCRKGAVGNPVVSRNEVLDLLDQASTAQPQIERWSESTRIRLAGSILTALRDFGLLDGKQKKVLVRPLLPLSTAKALVRVLIREGCRGREVIQNATWRLFLLTEQDVASTLAKLSQDGSIRFEKAGSTVVLETPHEWEESPL